MTNLKAEIEKLSSGVRIKEAVRKMKASEKALDFTKRSIMSQDSFISETAVRLGGLWLAYEFENTMHSRERVSAEIEASEDADFKLEREQDLKLEIETSRKSEKVLFEAQQGRYAEFRTDLKQTAEHLIDSDDEGTEDHEFGKKLMMLAEAIPDTGNRFTPPIPAWMNPNYAVDSE